MSLVKVSNIYANITSNSSIKNEHRDCVVRAFSLTLNVPYDQAHKDCANNGRKHGKGAYDKTVFAVAEKNGMKKVIMPSYCNPNFEAQSMTVNQFVKKHPKGKFYCHRRGHAFSIIDGVVHDWANGTGPKSKVILAYEAQ